MGNRRGRCGKQRRDGVDGRCRRPPREHALKVVIDARGLTWLCPVNVDTSADLEAQGCWRFKGHRPGQE